MKHFTKVIIENFQSHAHTELDLDSGINVIVGQSDKGKSAIIRAIKWLLTNEPKGSDFVRFGTDYCRVTIETSDGYKVSRIKKKNKNIYTVETPAGQVQSFENFGSDVPEEVLKATGVRKIKIDADMEILPSISGQLDAPFLLSETGSTKAKIIGSLVNTHLIDAAERDIQKDILNLTAEVKEINSQLEAVEAELEKYSDIARQEKAIEEMDRLVEELKKVYDTIGRLQGFSQKLASVEQEIQKTADIIAELSVLPQQEDAYLKLKDLFLQQKTLTALVDKLRDRERNIRETESLLEKLKNLPALSEKTEKLEKTAELGKLLCLKHSKLQAVVAGIKAEEKNLQKTQNLPKMQSKTELLEKLYLMGKTLAEKQTALLNIEKGLVKERKVAESVIHIDAAERKAAVLEKELQLTQKLLEHLRKYKEVTGSIAKGEAFMKDNDQKLEQAVSRYVEALKAVGRCPTCLHKISEEEILRMEQELKKGEF